MSPPSEPPPPGSKQDDNRNDSDASMPEDSAQCIGKRTRSRASLHSQPQGQETHHAESQAESSSTAHQRQEPVDRRQPAQRLQPSRSLSARLNVQTQRAPSPRASGAASSGPQRQAPEQPSSSRSSRLLRATSVKSNVPSSTSLSEFSSLSQPQQNGSSTMSLPRPTRSLPRRTSSTLTINRQQPQPQPQQRTSSPYSLRSCVASSSNIHSSANSNANIMPTRQSASRQANGCEPLLTGAGFGGEPFSSSSWRSTTPRTPLAEIPLWLADMRSESRRTGSSSSMIYEPEDPNGSYFEPHLDPRRSRTPSFSSSTGSLNVAASAIPKRRSTRDRRRRPSNENDPTPSTPAVPLQQQLSVEEEPSQASSQATDASTSSSGRLFPVATRATVSTRSRTAGRRSLSRTLSRSINPPFAIPSPSPPARQRSASVRSVLSVPQSPSFSRQGFTIDPSPGPTLLERRTAAQTITEDVEMRSVASGSVRSNRSSHRLRGEQGGSSSTTQGPQPHALTPLQIPAPPSANTLPWSPTMPSLTLRSTPSLSIPASSLLAFPSDAAYDRFEPTSPSLTNASTAAESYGSGMPATPATAASSSDPFSSDAGSLQSSQQQQPATRTERRARSSVATAAEKRDGELRLDGSLGLHFD